MERSGVWGALDVKGRIAMPSKYRSLLEQLANNQLVITIDTESKCLLIYPLAEWDLIQEKISALSSFNTIVGFPFPFPFDDDPPFPPPFSFFG